MTRSLMNAIVEEFTNERPIVVIAMLTHAERPWDFKVHQFSILSK